MKIDVISVGKIKEDFVLKGIKHYQKPLSKFTVITFKHVKPEPLDDNASDKDKETVKEKEAQALLSRANPSYRIALSPEGNLINSEAFAKTIEEVQIYHGSKLTFFIGGSHGLSNTLKQQADKVISFSTLTFPHQLFTLILTEQIFRAYKIINNEPYHK